MVDWPRGQIVLGATPPPEAKMPLHAYAAPSLRVDRNISSLGVGADFYGGLAAAARVAVVI